MEFLKSIFYWFSGGSNQYMTLLHCMNHDMFWIGLTVFLDAAVAVGYMLIAMHWWKNQKRVPVTPARRALGNIRNIFVFCGICGYAFIPIKMVYPAWRLYDFFMMVLVYFTWKYALQAKDLKVVYNELGRSSELAKDLAQAKDESRRKTHFLNSLSHDLRTPLNAIVLQSQLAKMVVDDNDVEQLKNSLKMIESNAQAAAEMLHTLLECAKIDWVDEPNKLSNISIAELLNQLAATSQQTAEAKGLYFRTVCPSQLILKTEASKLERILSNLVSNAIKFTDSGGVKIVVEQAADAVEIHVIDTGIGLSPQQQTRLFEEFYQVQNNGRDRTKGFGLGLSIARRLARQLGGDIEVESAAGQGSRFSVLLPGVFADSTVDSTAGPIAAEQAVVRTGTDG